MLTIVRFSEINGQPRVKIDLPHQRVGDPLALSFDLERKNQGRIETLVVRKGRFRVTAVGLDDNGQKQILGVDCIDPVPSWVSVKKRPVKGFEPRVLGPSRFPRTPIED